MSADAARLGPAVAGTRFGQPLAIAGYVLLLATCAAVSFTWLAIGVFVGVTAHVPVLGARVAEAAANGNPWARGLIEATPHSEPTAQAVLDYGFSFLAVTLAVAVLVAARGSWSIRLLALALISSAGAFNLQAHAAAMAVQAAAGTAIGGLHQALIGVASAAYVLVLVTFPPDGGAGPVRMVRFLAGAGLVLVAGTGTALLPPALGCVLLFGFLVPVAGLAVLPRKIRGGASAPVRTQARMLFSVLAATFAIAVVLVAITILVWSVGWTGLGLMDPATNGAGDEPIALMFWFARLACITIACAVLVATRGLGLWTAERVFSRGLAAALVAALVGGGYFAIRIMVGYAVDDFTSEGALVAAVVATVAAAVAFLPVYLRAERAVDRLLYGSRSTPYSVLAGIGEISRHTAPDAPDLARLAEAVGVGLGATTCRLTVVRKGLRDRTYVWTQPGANPSDELVEVPVRHGPDRIGTVAVDHAAAAGLHRQRWNLLEDIAESLGVVLQASRVGIELERQLRAAVAHANEIAVSRRAVVAEMDAERRRIERDLHDGAQHHLVSLRLALGLVEHEVSTTRLAEAKTRLGQIAEQIETAESILAETAAGVSAPTLAQLGLAGALEKELGGGPEPVGLDLDQAVAGVDRVPPEVEAAVYFCCLEAVNNARKHAPGAAIAVHLRIEAGHLHFTVTDDGPGWDPTAIAVTPGRGVRNVTARIAAVGGRIDIRSSPGSGTTVEGWAPLPAPADEPPPEEPPAEEAASSEAPAPAIVAHAHPEPLAEQVHRAVRAALEAYEGTPHAPTVLALAARLDEPMRVAVVGAPGAGADALAEGLEGVFESVRIIVADPAGAAGDGTLEPSADAFVLLVRHGNAEDAARLAVHGVQVPYRPAPAIGVLVTDLDAVDDPDRAAEALAARPDVGCLHATLVPVNPGLVRAAATLTEADVQALRCWAEPVDVAPDRGSGPAQLGGSAAPVAPAEAVSLVTAAQFDGVGLREAAELVRSGEAADAAALADALRRRGGLLRLRDVVDARFARQAGSLRARSVLLALEELARIAPAPGGARALLFELDRIRAGAHELIEIDTVDALLAGVLDVPAEDRMVAARLLGADGSASAVRLDLPPDADAAEVADSAAGELARWRRQALQPTATADLRAVAEVVVRTCERLLAGGQRG